MLDPSFFQSASILKILNLGYMGLQLYTFDQSIVPSLCSSLCVIIKSPRNSINETTMIFLGGELNAPKRQAQGHLKDVLHDFAHE